MLGIMNAVAYAVNAWLPVLTYPQTDSPRFEKGWIFSCVAFVVQFSLTGLVAWLWKREKAQKRKAGMETVAPDGEPEVLSERSAV